MAVNVETITNSESNLYKNVSSDQIQITVDKLKLKLEAFEKSNKRSSNWCTSFGIFITSAATLCTATFYERIGISADTWKGLFILVTFVSFIALILSPLIYWWNKISIEDFIEDCKKSE